MTGTTVDGDNANVIRDHLHWQTFRDLYVSVVQVLRSFPKQPGPSISSRSRRFWRSHPTSPMPLMPGPGKFSSSDVKTSRFLPHVTQTNCNYGCRPGTASELGIFRTRSLVLFACRITIENLGRRVPVSDCAEAPRNLGLGILQYCNAVPSNLRRAESFSREYPSTPTPAERGTTNNSATTQSGDRETANGDRVLSHRVLQ